MEYTPGTDSSASHAVDPRLTRRLNDLIEFEYDTIAAYEAALDRVEDWHALQTLRATLEDHKQHVRELAHQVKLLGGHPPIHGDARALITKGRVMLAGIIGDRAIWRALRSLEEKTNRAFEDALEYPELPANVREVLARGLSHERNHRQWIRNQIQPEAGD